MPETMEVVVKRQDDLVRLENVGGNGTVVFSYDGARYDVKDSIIVKRFIAEHGIKKSYSYDTHEYSLNIVELPFGQRSPEQYPDALAEAEKVHDENEKLKKENKELRAELVNLSSENDELIEQVKKLAKRK